MRSGKTVRIKGSPSLNDWFAEQMVKDQGPEGAREGCVGPMLEAVERVIAALESAKASP